MKSLLTALALLGCAQPTPPPLTVPTMQQVENDPLPADPRDGGLPEGTAPGEWTDSIESGSCLNAKQPCPPKSGILVSEAFAIRDSMIRRGYDALRAGYRADRRTWKDQRVLYETRLALADRAIRDLQPTWLERHALSIGALTGFVIGVLTVGLTLAAH